jgi:hypothetical protein
VAITEVTYAVSFAAEVGQTSASNESAKLQAVLETDASLLDVHTCVHRCEFAVLRTELGRCNRREFDGSYSEIAKGQFLTIADIDDHSHPNAPARIDGGD